MYAKEGGQPPVIDSDHPGGRPDRPDMLKMGEHTGKYGFVMNGSTALQALGVYSNMAENFTGYWNDAIDQDTAIANVVDLHEGSLREVGLDRFLAAVGASRAGGVFPSFRTGPWMAAEQGWRCTKTERAGARYFLIGTLVFIALMLGFPTVANLWYSVSDVSFYDLTGSAFRRPEQLLQRRSPTRASGMHSASR